MSIHDEYDHGKMDGFYTTNGKAGPNNELNQSSTKFDAFGPGIRVPMLIVSPYAKAGRVDTTFSGHSPVLKFIETVFALPTLASINHKFDTGTPKGSNYQADGAPFPPRDGNSALSDLTQCFTFG